MSRQQMDGHRRSSSVRLFSADPGNTPLWPAPILSRETFNGHESVTNSSHVWWR
ncbi:hypothetical protein BDA96_03G278400 [Sorghum bicolor]|uniref:Uncharacterized protein n=1 Tax=Sorghum bicolor TaxID=4558 RepID=A0A921REP9_SORBI|nr:hypothetical protein BDA96_03G278400 [Sorghum bicolor]